MNLDLDNSPVLADLLLPAAFATIVAILFVLLLVLAKGKKQLPGTVPQRHWVARISYLGFLVSVVILCLTAFGSIMRYGHMANNALLAHVSIAGAFVFFLTIIAYSYLPNARSAANKVWFVERWSSWGLVLSSLCAAGTMMISMLPILGTNQLLDALQWHRMAGFATAVAATFHLLSLILGKLGYR